MKTFNIFLSFAFAVLVALGASQVNATNHYDSCVVMSSTPTVADVLQKCKNLGYIPSNSELVSFTSVIWDADNLDAFTGELTYTYVDGGLVTVIGILRVSTTKYCELCACCTEDIFII